MKLLLAVKVAHGASAPQFPATPGSGNFANYGAKVGDVKGGAIYVVLLDVEAAFEVEE